MLSGKLPFTGTPEEIKDGILNGEIPQKSHFSSEAKDLIKKLLCKNPEERLCSINEIKLHPFYSGIDWDRLIQDRSKSSYSLLTKPQELSDITNEIREPDSSKHSNLTLYQNLTYAHSLQFVSISSNSPHMDTVDESPEQVYL